MLGDFLRRRRGSSRSGDVTKMRTLYEWRCECGAHSRSGDPSESHAEYNAQRHQWNKGVGHPMPEVFTTQVEVPADWP